MQIKTLKVGPLRTNCYLLIKENAALIIDPGDEAERIIATLNGVFPKAILLTHGHFDHIGALQDLKAKLKVPIYLQNEALDEYRVAKEHGEVLGISIPEPPKPDYDLTDTVKIDGFSGKVIKTPGHTKGSVCFLFGDNLFSGDTLFKGTCGRTDLPFSDHREMIISLKSLLKLLPQTVIYPGHGDQTTLRDEIRWIDEFTR
ncbi:TPA: hydrolase [candidate division CPR2 bacterium]|uniref:Beta-lactamase domain protein n=1 Tax=candidate division CPR2 bacterium GW2011_GWC1_41_48 TaxID=1618344 RepID=A0A0G0WA39_UNCC2|nr:MAG: Beta-lactamase domain protein [candidate division CPR2 bacterium GW2011_GWC2_39_35]KKR28872.1 MAG: Beta-lactamase domain protein [candidate division CPR2 bacterium GW2011_GWD1_39_7]KKR29155.1 MAG: Beta-lactamase domain protein [candidate division CPR2 bacterium GW2011_GWD2_39_7]KKS09869.1 MAG: Beta-lactamase domain protein [candidate division CPR2 bacterium GW2011_GWC1_41_48]OGB61500.1 MAG: hypothetical protein A2Y27_02500 [candidate division CPR2 bacterium GWD1_39_7]OGB70646.1 MAG: hy